MSIFDPTHMRAAESSRVLWTSVLTCGGVLGRRGAAWAGGARARRMWGGRGGGGGGGGGAARGIGDTTRKPPGTGNGQKICQVSLYTGNYETKPSLFCVLRRPGSHGEDAATTMPSKFENDFGHGNNSRSPVDFNFSSVLHPDRIAKRDGRRDVTWTGTGRSCAESGTDARARGDFGFISSPRLQRGMALEKLDKFFERQPRGWAEAPKYVTESQRAQLAEREAAAERRAALRRVAAAKAAAEAEKEKAAREEDERIAAEANQKIAEDLRHAREQIFKWAPGGAAMIPLAVSLSEANDRKTASMVDVGP